MRRYNILVVSRTLLIPAVIAFKFALAAPVLVQEKRQACVDVMNVPDMITVFGSFGKRALDEDLNVLWDGLWHYDNVWRNRNPAAVQPQELGEVHIPPQSPADTILGSWSDHSDDDALPESPESGHSHSTHTSLANSEPESMVLDGDAPPASTDRSSESEDWHTPSSSPGWSTKSEDWYTPPSLPPSSLGSSTESDSDRWSTISNAPSAESQSKNLKAADSEMRGKAKVSRRIFGPTSTGVDS